MGRFIDYRNLRGAWRKMSGELQLPLEFATYNRAFTDTAKGK